MLKCYKILFLFLTVSILSACSLMPESIALQPQIDVPTTHIGNNQTVAVNVIDVRPNRTTIGGRATALGPAANIKLAGDLSSVVSVKIDEGLRKNGFQPIPYNDKAPRKLVVQITDLQYKQHTGLWSGTIIITSTLNGIANNKNKTYRKTYLTEDKHAVELTPTTASDEQHINQALAKSLNQLLTDQQLMNFLAK